MIDMNMQDRYDDISKISGLSEEIVRRVLKATKQSCATSLKHGYRATVPGICTILPEKRTRLMIGGDMQNYVKLKIKPSAALESEMENLVETDASTEEDGISKLNIVQPELLGGYKKGTGIRTKQISALM